MIYSKQTLKIVKDMIKFITETYNTKLLRLEYDERTMEFVVCFDKEKIITRYLDDDDYKYLMDFFEGIPFDIKFLPAEDVDYRIDKPKRFVDEYQIECIINDIQTRAVKYQIERKKHEIASISTVYDLSLAENYKESDRWKAECPNKIIVELKNGIKEEFSVLDGCDIFMRLMENLIYTKRRKY